MDTPTKEPEYCADSSLNMNAGCPPVEMGRHTWDDGRTLGRCLTRYTCIVCGAWKTVDSSD